MAHGWQRRVRAATALLAASVAVLASGCGSGTEAGERADTADPTSTLFPPGESGAFMVDPVPDGWEIERAYDQDKGTGVYYRRTDDGDRTFSVLTFTVDPDDPQLQQWRDAMATGGEGIDGVSTIEVAGHEAFRGPLTDDGRTYGDEVTWFARPDLVVQVGVPFDAGLDVEEMAARTHEVDGGAFADLVGATSGGGVPGPRIEALRGNVDGDEWVLTAVLPEGYPVEPVDHRRGCAELTFRGEISSTCGDAGGRTFTPLDEGRQAILGDVVFVYGVIGDGRGDVVVGQPERPEGPWTKADAVVVTEAPELTWFVTTFDDICDRLAGSNGELVGIVVPDGYPHRNDCAV